MFDTLNECYSNGTGVFEDLYLEGGFELVVWIT